ncbi:hypothetical protein LguiA_013708 [Lonicera macranthoides]
MEDRAAAERWLKAAEYFLQHRDLAACRSYTLKAQKSSPNLPSIPQILAVADVLTVAGTLISGTTHPNFYSILQVPPFSRDTSLINHKFNHLLTLLNPNSNKFPLANEAFELVVNAWSVLSDPVKRRRFDNLVQNSNNDKDFGSNCRKEYDKNDDLFWTICPYCYYVYEFARVYEDCCLKCDNEKCGRAFHAVEIRAPPIEVVKSGEYRCNGFYPLGFSAGGGGGGEGCSSWMPFMPVGISAKAEVKGAKSVRESDNGNVGGKDSLIEITDDSGDNLESEVVSKNARVFGNDSNRVQADKGKGSGDFVKLVMKRKKKSVAKATKKLMGRGTRIEKHETVVAQSGEELDLNAEATSEDDQDFGTGFVGGMEIGSGDEFVVGGVEFFEGDGDVFVGFPEGF